MSKVITFSRQFPEYHPRAGQPTNFAEKIWHGLRCHGICNVTKVGLREYNPNNEIIEEFIKGVLPYFDDKKYHTIRSGYRWSVGDKFSPRVWSGKPYNSKQIIIAPDIEIVKVWDIIIVNHGNHMFIKIEHGDGTGVQNDCIDYDNYPHDNLLLGRLSQNDGLTVTDFKYWFPLKKRKHVTRYDGQIICWNPNIQY